MSSAVDPPEAKDPANGMEQPSTKTPAKTPTKTPAKKTPAAIAEPSVPWVNPISPHPRPSAFSVPKHRTGKKNVTKSPRIVGILPWQLLDCPPRSGTKRARTPTIDDVRSHIEGMDIKLGHQQPPRPASCLTIRHGMGDETTDDPKPIVTKDEVMEFRMRNNFPISKVVPREYSTSPYDLADSCSYHVRHFKGLRDVEAKDLAMRGLGSVDTLLNRYGYVERKDRRRPGVQVPAVPAV